MELAPVPDYKSNCTFQTDKRSLRFNYAHVVFNKHFHLAAVRGNGAKGGLQTWLRLQGPGLGSRSGCGQMRLAKGQGWEPIRWGSRLCGLLPGSSMRILTYVCSAGPSCVPSIPLVQPRPKSTSLASLRMGRGENGDSPQPYLAHPPQFCSSAPAPAPFTQDPHVILAKSFSAKS